MEPIYFGGALILGAAVWIICVVFAYQNAPKRGRRAPVWALLTLLFGPLALFALFLMKPKGSGGSTGSGGHHDPRADLYQVPKKR